MEVIRTSRRNQNELVLCCDHDATVATRAKGMNDTHPHVHEGRTDGKSKEHNDSNRKYWSLRYIVHAAPHNNKCSDESCAHCNEQLSKLEGLMQSNISSHNFEGKKLKNA